ncbi:DNA glycosylase AlkZ-like family protein [Micromonospora coxensis]|uniref:Winged helix DNA-binding domain-containing protein n=1 Tax=Micromonospora coxensis TaxID=356852 RepID=A0A1C5J5I3_9ACTN|nr:crosslink repair DNA glycosylase YcaQ family protein [Micromonospora coxensis]SCG65306.1 Winged helix DNA-binding domain-containing protein [Micromonospora coxensis]
MAVTNLSVEQVLAWRARRQLLHRPPGTDAVAVVGRLAGVQAQVASAAEQAVAARQPAPRPGTTAAALADRTLVKTWAMRGALHLLPTAEAAAYLALLAAGRFWEKGSWQRSFVTVGQLDAIAEAARSALDGRVLGREALTAEIVERTGDAALAAHLGSGWGAVLKPLAWQGLLVHGPADGNRVTFTRPDTYLPGWSGLPAPEEAAARVVPAYLGAYGPADPETFDQWLSRGGSKRPMLRGWFRTLVEAGELVPVTVDGRPGYARAGDLPEIAAAEPTDDVRLLPAFDQWVLGPGTRDTTVVPAARRADVSRTAGWITPVVVHRGRVVGTWEARDGEPEVTLWPESPPVPADRLDEERSRLRSYLKGVGDA